MRVELARLGKGTLTYGLGGVLNRFIGFLLLPFFTAYLMPTKKRNAEPSDKDLDFVRQRVQRLGEFRDRAQGFFSSPIVRMLLKK